MNYNSHLEREWEKENLDLPQLLYKPSQHFSRYIPSLKHLIPIRKNDRYK